MSTQRSYTSGWDRIYQKSVQQPWIPIGTLLTVGAFTGAYINLRKGNKKKGVQWLRYRVAFQGITIIGMALGSLILAPKPYLEKKPEQVDNGNVEGLKKE
ncbi:hypothetical protein CONCODRAFT_79058 [Conidiobolus coronatus NRRL 28638]|uniref:HIG1 domain-containing protein n=1 Tax=Conidiobolus coronatus (strain ATCC 28846 / CBS 209.66 / NRRL 28638) TaxID=796925 RepID=A0A137P4R6_CONC2|nr:hypothetical protein CONCODRAFT_79058 [Conidiobolus coronatus NRRL 28638]|eukprot:KXN69995.1 hypothetical protein CONCODRAFT_79058 [Conidiobolus coronatus NRRL 28638]